MEPNRAERAAFSVQPTDTIHKIGFLESCRQSPASGLIETTASLDRSEAGSGVSGSLVQARLPCTLGVGPRLLLPPWNADPAGIADLQR